MSVFRSWDQRLAVSGLPRLPSLLLYFEKTVSFARAGFRSDKRFLFGGLERNPLLKRSDR